jgi:N utilization substance protein B
MAFQALYCWESAKISADELMLFPWLDKGKRESMDEGMAVFSRMLIAGTIENIKTIDSAIKKHLEHWDISRIGRVDLAILRMSVYTLLYQKEIAPSIVIDEAIGISKEYGADDSFRFVNGVLDSINKSISAGKEKF